MTILRVIATVAMALLISACSGLFDEGFYEREFPSYLPSEDPLVLAYFEKALNDNELAYRRNAAGEYSVLDHSRDDELEDLAAEYSKFSVTKSMLQVEKGCAAQIMQAYLRDEGIVYVVVVDDTGAFLQMSQADFNEHNLPERWAEFERACLEKTGE